MGQARTGYHVLAAFHADLVSFTCPFSRLIGFGACLLGAAVCFFVAFLTAPLIPIRPAKFALALRSVPPSYPVLRPHHPSVPAWGASWSCSGSSNIIVSPCTSHPLTKFIFRSFTVLVGPITHLKHLVSKERLPFSVAYISSLALTIYFSISVSFISSWPSITQKLSHRSRSNRIWAP